jgi:hypothetical protein
VDQQGLVYLSRSQDGGQTWQEPKTTADNAVGISGVPVVQPNGNVVVPILGFDFERIYSFRSTDGGQSWSESTPISDVEQESTRGSLRTYPTPSAVTDAAGNIYVVWADCRFRPGCDANDIVMMTSPDGVSWSEISKVNLGLTEIGASLIFPGIGADPRIGADQPARLGMVFYSVGGAGCAENPGSCQILAQYASSSDAGKTWSTPKALSAAMNPDWVSTTFRGKMIGDYTQVAFAGGIAFPIFTIAGPPQGGLDYNQGVYTAPQAP